MRLGVAYNFFDGEELLLASIKTIKPFASFITVIFQEISNRGNYRSDESIKVLNKLLDSKLINEVVVFNPQGKSCEGLPTPNIETAKRNIGLKRIKQNKCTHYLCMDADEFYREKEFAAAIRLIEDKNIESSFCLFDTFYKLPIYKEVDTRGMTFPRNPRRTALSFIFKIYPDMVHQHNGYASIRNFKALIDPTRMVVPLRRPYYFPPNQLMMQHMSWVRKNIEAKVLNSTAADNPAFVEMGKKIIKGYSSWEPGGKLAGFPKDIETVEDEFGLMQIFKGE